MKSSAPNLHIPVLLEDTCRILDIQKDDIIVDGTVGYGGHSSAMVKELGDRGRLIGLDQDPVAVAHCTEKFKQTPNVSIHHANFADLGSVLSHLNLAYASKILVDLGLSSVHLDQSNRGFTYSQDEPLDMRMNPAPNTPTAADILNTYPADQLTTIFIDYGDIRRPEKLVDTVIHTRKTHPYTTTTDLIATIKKSFFFKNKRRLYIKTLSQVFQALRIEVNHEFDALTQFLNHLSTCLKPTGRVAIITFHSGEDRLVKQFFRAHKTKFRPVTTKVISPSWADTRHNPRARSAKLRGYEKHEGTENLG